MKISNGETPFRNTTEMKISNGEKKIEGVVKALSYREIKREKVFKCSQKPEAKLLNRQLTTNNRLLTTKMVQALRESRI